MINSLILNGSELDLTTFVSVSPCKFKEFFSDIKILNVKGSCNYVCLFVVDIEIIIDHVNGAKLAIFSLAKASFVVRFLLEFPRLNSNVKEAR